MEAAPREHDLRRPLRCAAPTTVLRMPQARATLRRPRRTEEDEHAGVQIPLDARAS